MAADDRGVDKPDAWWDDEDAVDVWPDEMGRYPPPGPVSGPTDALAQRRPPRGEFNVPDASDPSASSVSESRREIDDMRARLGLRPYSYRTC
eukprot:2044048-Alexandrium_andersonii.AAC.1